MTNPKDIKSELMGDLEATDEEAESVKGGFLATKKTKKIAFHEKTRGHA